MMVSRDNVLYEYFSDKWRRVSEETYRMAAELAAKRIEVFKLRTALEKSLEERARLRGLLAEAMEGTGK